MNTNSDDESLKKDEDLSTEKTTTQEAAPIAPAEGESTSASSVNPSQDEASDDKSAAVPKKPLAEGAETTQKIPLKGSKKDTPKAEQQKPLARGAESTAKIPLKGGKKDTPKTEQQKPLAKGAESTTKMPPRGGRKDVPLAKGAESTEKILPKVSESDNKGDSLKSALIDEENEQARPWAMQKGPAIAIICALTLFIVVISAYVFNPGSEQVMGDGANALVSEELDPSEAMELKVFYPVRG